MVLERESGAVLSGSEMFVTTVLLSVKNIKTKM
jgi:hypothetical protein